MYILEYIGTPKIIYLESQVMTLAGKFFTFEKRGLRSFLVALLLSNAAFAADRVVGANSSLEINPGARSAGLGSAALAVDGDYLGLTSNPQQLANVNYAWASLSHTEYYENTQFDYASAVVPLGAGQGIGVSFARFGANDIPYIKDGEPLPEGFLYETLSIADWMFSVSYGRKLFDRFEVGVSFHGLYRDLDQSGFGFRSDIGVRYHVIDQLYVSGLLKGWTSSATAWGSGEFEYTSPEVYLAASYGLAVPYLYGKLGMYWQSAGLFHQESREMGFGSDDRGGRIWESPLDWLSGGRGGLEMAFDFGLSLRLGLSSFTTFQSVTAGAGIVIAKFLKIDYAFESHPVLSPVHRISVSFSPYLFSKKPRPGTPEAAAAVRKPTLLTEEVEEEEVVADHIPEIVEEPVDPTPTENPAANSAAEPAANLAAEPVQSTSEQPVQPQENADPAPAKGTIVETDDEILE